MLRITARSSGQPSPRVVAATVVPRVSRTTCLSAVTASDGRLSYSMSAAYAARVSVALVDWRQCVAIAHPACLFRYCTRHLAPEDSAEGNSRPPGPPPVRRLKPGPPRLQHSTATGSDDAVCRAPVVA